MCGIAGIARQEPTGVNANVLGRMAAAMRHRGPDGYGFYTGRRVGLTHVRLGVSDIWGAGQPLTNEDGRIVVTSTCEVYNHPELRQELTARGHVFRTKCHAEVLVHGYEEWGANLLSRLDGQFAFAVYDRNRETVFVARDRFGVRPLFYAQRNGDFYFGSEIKAILATGEIDAAYDQRGVDEILRFGGARPPRTAFSGIASLEPGTYGIWKDGALWLRHYYELDYPEAPDEPADVIEQLDEIMLRSVGMRLRADIPIGAFVTGGLDSAITASLTRSALPYPLRSFSITHAMPEYDASLQQHQAADALGSVHVAGAIEMDTIAATFPDVVWHSETPLLHTEPAMIFHLAKIARECGVKAVISGDGADEIFLGSELFRETAVRRFCLRQPESCIRPSLFSRVRGDWTEPLKQSVWQQLLDAADESDPLFSHMPRFRRTLVDDFYSPEFRAALGGTDVVGELRSSLPTRFFGWSQPNQAAYLEMTTHLSPYLISSRGDRMTLAHGVEARYPFLDHRVFEFAAGLPTTSRLRGLRGKEVLRRWAKRVLPDRLEATEQSYPSQEAQCFFLPSSPSWIGDHLTSEAVRRVGIFSSSAVGGLVRRCQGDGGCSTGENETLIGVLSTQLWHHQFVESALFVTPLPVSGASVLLGDKVPITSAHALYDPEPC